MNKALQTRLDWATMVIMAAAVADYRPTETAGHKIKKGAGARTLALTPTDDILEGLSKRKTRQILVGFAAETGDLITHASDKLRRKGLDLIVANDVTREGAGFGSDRNAATLIDRTGHATTLDLMPKRQMADCILDAIQPLTRSPRTGFRS
jgi:phosphopantothenoylcysteine decarboxylase/phosphopantothenate--cysteine ligase